jgi:hypothetical protein
MTGRLSPHPDEDRLLELAYGEAPPAETRALRQHVDGCTRCRDVLQGIAEVRSAVRSVPPEPAPERGLDSLLAYGEQAAARARSRRRSLRLVGLLSVATAALLAWVLLPVSPRERSEDRDLLASAEVPTPAQAPPPFAKPTLVAPAPTAPAPREERKTEQARREVSGATGAAPKTDERQKDAAKVASRERGDSSTPSSPPAAVAMSKRAAPVPDRHSAAATSPPVVASRTAPAGSPNPERAREPAAGGLMELGDGRTQADRSGPATAANVGTGSGARAVSNSQKARSASEAPVDKKQTSSTVQPLRPADRPPKAARLEQVRREVVQASGDSRKALLFEQCRLEAELQMGPAAVQTCSQVAREFPGTPEAKQATELASGFSVQPLPR